MNRSACEEVRVTPLVDTNSLLAIKSLFGGGRVDPWAIELASDFTDLFVYADWVRFPLGSPHGGLSGIDWANAPAIAQHLQRRDSSAVVPLVLSTKEPVRLHDDYVTDAFRSFAVWARNNRSRLRQWLDIHNTSGVRAMQQAQVARQHYFNLERLTQEPELEALGRGLPAQQSEVLYAFDNVLRGPLYGSLTGNDQHYLNHPLRDVSLLPTFEAEAGSPPPIAVSFKESMGRALRHLSFDEYCVILHELRGAVRSRGIHELGRGGVEKEVLREIAAFVSLPPRLRGLGQLALFSGGIIGALAAVPALGATTAVVGAAVSVSSALWTGQLPRSVARIKWLRWGIKWDLESQAEIQQN
jgi:hypothetical protein